VMTPGIQILWWSMVIWIGLRRRGWCGDNFIKGLLWIRYSVKPILNALPGLLLLHCSKDMGSYPSLISFTFHYLAFVSHDSLPYLSVVVM